MVAVLNMGSTVGVGTTSRLRSGDFSLWSSLALELFMRSITGFW